MVQRPSLLEGGVRVLSMRDSKWPTGLAMRIFYEQAPEKPMKMVAFLLAGQSCATKGFTVVERRFYNSKCLVNMPVV